MPSRYKAQGQFEQMGSCLRFQATPAPQRNIRDNIDVLIQFLTGYGAVGKQFLSLGRVAQNGNRGESDSRTKLNERPLELLLTQERQEALVLVGVFKYRSAVEEIAESEFFQSLTERAARIRQKQRSSRTPDADKK